MPLIRSIFDVKWFHALKIRESGHPNLTNRRSTQAIFQARSIDVWNWGAEGDKKEGEFYFKLKEENVGQKGIEKWIEGMKGAFSR